MCFNLSHFLIRLALILKPSTSLVGFTFSNNLLDLEYTEFGLKKIEKLPVEVGCERRLYRRYLGDVRAQRKKVITAWCEFNQDKNLNSRNELNGAGGVDT